MLTFSCRPAATPDPYVFWRSLTSQVRAKEVPPVTNVIKGQKRARCQRALDIQYKKSKTTEVIIEMNPLRLAITIWMALMIYHLHWRGMLIN